MRAIAIGLIVTGSITAFLSIGYAVSELIDDPSRHSAGSTSRATPAPGALFSPAATSAADAALPSGAAGESPAAPQGTPLRPTPNPSDQGTQAPATGAGRGSGGGTAAGGAGGPTTGGSVLPLPAVADRKVVRNSAIALTVEDVFGAVQKVEEFAISAGGFVAESSLMEEELAKPATATQDEPPPKRQTATVKIRVPAENYNTVMNQVRGIAKERDSESSTASEVTEEYADLEARLRNLQASEARYLELLGLANTIPDILAMEDRLNGVRVQIEQAQGRLNLLNDLTSLATITVTLAPPPIPQPEPTPAPTPVVQAEPDWAEDAWDNSWQKSEDALETLGAAAITEAVVSVWIVIPGLALLIAWRLFRPRGARKQAM